MAARRLAIARDPFTALSEATTARIQALPLEQLEALAEALLVFNGPGGVDGLVGRPLRLSAESQFVCSS